MSIDDVLAKTTYRQYLCWMEYFDQQLNDPDNILVYYLMQLTAEIRRLPGYFLGGKNATKVKLEHFKLSFGKKGKEQKRTPYHLLSKEEKEKWDNIQRTTWASRLGTTIKKLTSRENKPASNEYIDGYKPKDN